MVDGEYLRVNYKNKFIVYFDTTLTIKIDEHIFNKEIIEKIITINPNKTKLDEDFT